MSFKTERFKLVHATFYHLWFHELIKVTSIRKQSLLLHQVLLLNVDHSRVSKVWWELELRYCELYQYWYWTYYILGIEKLLIGKMHIMSQFPNRKIVKIAIVAYWIQKKENSVFLLRNVRTTWVSNIFISALHVPKFP